MQAGLGEKVRERENMQGMIRGDLKHLQGISCGRKKRREFVSFSAAKCRDKQLRGSCDSRVGKSGDSARELKTLPRSFQNKIKNKTGSLQK